MKVSELARRAGVSKETIHFYLREGLLPKPRKAGRNMAFYDEAHLERLRLIKRLQKERFLPLGVIKKVLGGERQAEPELERLVGELYALTVGSETPAGEGRVSRAELARRTGLPPEELDALAAEGLVVPGPGGYALEDVRVAELIAAAQREAGFEPAFAVKIFALYRRHLERLAREEAQLYSQAILASGRPLEYVEGIRRAREVTNRYLLAERARLVRGEIDRYVAEVERVVAGDGEPPLFSASPALAAAGAADRSAREQGGDQDLDALEARFRADLAADPRRGLTRALLGSALVRKARRALREEGGRHAVRYLTEGLAELAASEAAGPAPTSVALLAQLVRGRVYVAMPRFFGTFERGLADLDAVVRRGTAPGADATAAWMAANASYFIGVALWREPGRRAEARAAFERAAAIDQDGPLAARAREWLADRTATGGNA